MPAAFVVLAALPLTAERQGRPPGAAGARRSAPASRRTARRRARRSRSCWPAIWSPRCWGCERVGARGQLLRPRRPLAARDPGGVAGARGLRGRAAAARRSSRRRRVAGAGRGGRRRRAARRRGRALPPLVPAARERAACPLSFAQQRLWFLDQLAPGQLDLQHPGRAARSTRRARRRRRSRGSLTRGRAPARDRCAPLPRASTAQPGAGDRPGRRRSALPLVDLGGACPRRGARGRAGGGSAAEEAAAALRPRRAGRCCAPLLLRLAAERPRPAARRCTTSSRDGWSMRHPAARAGGALRAPSWRGGRRRCRELPVQYADFAVWQRAAGSSGEVLERQLAYWRERLAGAPAVLDLPTDRPRPAVQSLRGASRALVPAGGAGRGAARRWRRREGVDPLHGPARRASTALLPASAARRTSRSARRSPTATARRSRG